ncbi:ATP-dependent helicase HrpB [Paraglaciecola sp. MB-3u-78]|uniref:ATP-dependent helicase HrpB n=1 Tax=Paraglaciecola sp. MB-3u-78 TaxID=2058332 RepID=UPI000C334770|nr:ATP-dependent helicase HrpB [Paraglaciecola sp. MB-3u-78]PKG99843.1 ATP-dependent helicase HrpB [Paraglaciecola sp. MB-3u-78]
MLPVEHILPALHKQLLVGDAIVVAPPGAGKSTCLPLSLLKLDVFKDKKIILLQPRRIAVRTIASYLASQLGESVGHTIGYRIRGEVKVSANTRIEIVTEGILTRMLQNQPDLPDVGLVIFDEFHERSVHADFSLALCIEVQQALRDDLRLLVMSATLDVAALGELLPAAKLLESSGKSYPVDIIYHPDNSSLHLFEKVCRLVIQVFPKHQHDCLVFLPGAADINKAAQRLSQHFATEVEVLKLFSELSKNEQQQALLPNPEGKRKIVLATNIAETSLTIEGIEIVVDSGIEKKAIFQLNRGITHLQSQKISQASATQRAGRAGRLTAGTCYRLWSKEQHGRLAKQITPEIMHSDMSSFILESAIWGSDVSALALQDHPSDAQLSQGFALLSQLELLDNNKKLTALGRKAHGLGCHPSIAVMLLKSAKMSTEHLSMACALAALIENKDPMGRTANGASLAARLHFVLQQKNHVIWQAIRQWHSKLACRLLVWPLEDTAVLVGYAYPQWLAKQRKDERYQLVNGSGAVLYQDDALTTHSWLAVANMQTSDRQQDNAQIRYAESLTLLQLEQHFEHLIEKKERVNWDPENQRIVSEMHQTLGKIIIHKQPIKRPSAQHILTIWRDVIQTKGIANIPFNDEVQQLIHRVQLAASLAGTPSFSAFKAFPDFSGSGLLNSIDRWLMPYLADILTWQQFTQCHFLQQLLNELDFAQQQSLNKQLPKQLALPSGRNAQLTYTSGNSVVLSVRMTELYGLQRHPTVAQQQVPITVELLSPAGRPIQTTQDLPRFWQGSYKEVQKEMKGRYPRHFWPDDPANAQATARTKKRMSSKP